MAKLNDYIAATLEALHNKQKIDFLEEADRIIEQILDPDYEPPKSRPKKNITKVLSHNHFMKHYQGAVYQSIYHDLRNYPEPRSRSEIAQRLNLRLSTVCGRIGELLESGAICVVGHTIDPETNRTVELLTTSFNK